MTSTRPVSAGTGRRGSSPSSTPRSCARRNRTWPGGWTSTPATARGPGPQRAPPGPAAQVSYTPIEQQELPDGQPLDEFLGTIAWPDAVGGCALTVERLMLPPAAEAEVPEDLDEAGLAAWVAEHPGRQEVRMTVGVLRDGTREAALRLRSKDAPTEVLTGPDLVPGLARALAATFD